MLFGHVGLCWRLGELHKQTHHSEGGSLMDHTWKDHYEDSNPKVSLNIWNKASHFPHLWGNEFCGAPSMRPRQKLGQPPALWELQGIVQCLTAISVGSKRK